MYIVLYNNIMQLYIDIMQLDIIYISCSFAFTEILTQQPFLSYEIISITGSYRFIEPLNQNDIKGHCVKEFCHLD